MYLKINFAALACLTLLPIVSCNESGVRTLDDRSRSKLSSSKPSIPKEMESHQKTPVSILKEINLEDSLIYPALKKGSVDQEPIEENPSQSGVNPPAPNPSNPVEQPSDTLEASELCSLAAGKVKLTEEHSYLCNGNQPTALLQQLFATPYRGGSGLATTLISSKDLNGISRFVIATSSLYDNSFDAMISQSQELTSMNVQAGNARFTSNLINELPASGQYDLGGFVTREVLTIDVVIVTIEDETVVNVKSSTLAPNKLVMTEKQLKPGEEANADNTRANQLNYWIARGDQTLIVTLVYQEADNKGQHSMAESTSKNISDAIAKETYIKLSQ